VKQTIKTYMGNDESKRFEEALSDAQSKLGGLIGNPLLGGGDSDLKLKTAREQFGSNITLKNLQGQVAVAKEIMNNARSRMIQRNRYLQQRYGEEYGAGPGGAGGTAPIPKPAGSTGTAKGPDNRMHWTNKAGDDLGVAQ
jgi:hypothetical protein